MTTKTYAFSSVLAAATALAASPLAAHPGDHAGLDVGGFMSHFAQQPFHASGLLLAIVLAAFAVVKLRKAKVDRRGK